MIAMTGGALILGYHVKNYRKIENIIKDFLSRVYIDEFIMTITVWG